MQPNHRPLFRPLSATMLLLLLLCGFSLGQKHGIAGKPAPGWKTSSWHQLPPSKTSLDVTDYKGKILFLYFFQSWCPGCHSSGFPTLKKLTEAFADEKDVAFVAIQTTFEGHKINSADKLKTTADRYKLKIPFGQSAGTKGTPDIMYRYRTGGTPWVVLINGEGRVMFNNFHADPAKAEVAIKAMLEEMQEKAAAKKTPAP